MPFKWVSPRWEWNPGEWLNTPSTLPANLYPMGGSNFWTFLLVYKYSSLFLFFTCCKGLHRTDWFLWLTYQVWGGTIPPKFPEACTSSDPFVTHVIWVRQIIVRMKPCWMGSYSIDLISEPKSHWWDNFFVFNIFISAQIYSSLSSFFRSKRVLSFRRV